MIFLHGNIKCGYRFIWKRKRKIISIKIHIFLGLWIGIMNKLPFTSAFNKTVLNNY